MEIDDLKQGWAELSNRLDRQQIVSRTLLENSVRQRRHSIADFTRFNVATTAMAFPICIGIALWRVLIGLNILWGGMAGLGIVLLFEIRKSLLIHRMNHRETDIAAQQRLTNRYRCTQIYAYLFSNLFVIGYISWILLTKWEAFGISRAGLLIGTLCGAIILGIWLFLRETDAIQELRKASRDLEEFTKN